MKFTIALLTLAIMVLILTEKSYSNKTTVLSTVSIIRYTALLDFDMKRCINAIFVKYLLCSYMQLRVHFFLLKARIKNLEKLKNGVGRGKDLKYFIVMRYLLNY